MASRFLIRCKVCRWTREAPGTSKDLVDLKEIKPSCASCGKPRRFVCPKCKGVAVMTRVYD